MKVSGEGMAGCASTTWPKPAAWRESAAIDFDVFHIVGTPEVDQTCNSAWARQLLGLIYRGDLDQYS